MLSNGVYSCDVPCNLCNKWVGGCVCHRMHLKNDRLVPVRELVERVKSGKGRRGLLDAFDYVFAARLFGCEEDTEALAQMQRGVCECPRHDLDFDKAGLGYF